MNIARTIIVVVGLIAALAAAWWLQNRPSASGGAAVQPAAVASAARSAGAAGPGGQAGPIGVEVGKVERMRLEEVAQAVGSLRAHQSVMLRPEVSGRIAALGFEDGQRVRRGQWLVQLDDTLQQAQLKQAEAQAGIARTNLQRSRELLQQNFVSQSAVDQNAAAQEVALAQVALAQAQLSRMKILAPFDGVAGIRSVSLGDYVKDGADLVGLEDRSSLWVDFRLPERYVAKVTVGQVVELTLDALPDRRFSAKVAALDSLLDANGRSVLVRARLVNGDGVLRGGMFARARVVFEVREHALVVPEEALVPQGSKQYVIKVAGSDGARRSQRIEARIGQRTGGKVELLEGVEAGDLVVLAGQARLMRGDGLEVRIVDIDRPAGGKPGGGAGAGAGASGPARAGSSPA